MTHFKEKIKQERLAFGTLIHKPFVLPGVATLAISFVAGTRHDADHGLSASLLANWAREATRERSREDLSEFLESRAISLQISVDTTRTSIYITCPNDEIERALAVAADICRAPRFDKADYELVRLRMVTGLRQALESTEARAEEQMWGTLFPEAHPNYEEGAGQSITRLLRLTPAQVERCWRKNWGANGLVLAATGEVKYTLLKSLFSKHFGSWASTGLAATFNHETKTLAKRKGPEVTRMEGKASVDVLWAEPLNLDIWSREYQALRLAARALGGHGFSSRLMSIVRDKHGLTYGTYANLRGLTRGDSGALVVNASFAPALYQKGLGVTNKVLTDFAKRGVTSEELEQMRENLLGSIEVGLSTSSGVLRALLEIAENGRPLSNVDDTILTVRALDLGEVNAAVKKFVHPGKFLSFAVGTI